VKMDELGMGRQINTSGDTRDELLPKGSNLKQEEKGIKMKEFGILRNMFSEGLVFEDLRGWEKPSDR